MAHGETEIELKSNGKCAIRTVTEWAQTAEIKLNAERTQLISLGQNGIKELEINEADRRSSLLNLSMVIDNGLR